jgi:predicted RND superfamily exporter protein
MEKNQNEIAIVDEKIKGLRTMVESTKVTSDEELAKASDLTKQIKVMAKFLKEKKEIFVKPANEIIAQAKSIYDGPIKECLNAEEVIKQRMGKYMTDQAEIRRKQEQEIADKLEKGKIKTETAVRRIEKLPDAPKNVQTANSGVQLRKRKVATIQDKNLIPDEYWIVDEVRVRRDALDREKNGLHQIPGVIITEETSVASL